jgi:hypothetical protein
MARHRPPLVAEVLPDTYSVILTVPFTRVKE